MYFENISSLQRYIQIQYAEWYFFKIDLCIYIQEDNGPQCLNEHVRVGVKCPYGHTKVYYI